jgi:cell wall-associated NlpC family hydrolase
MTGLDRRLTPARGDLAAAHLRGEVEAARFVEGRALRVVEPVIDLRRAPDPALGAETQALFGEEIVVYDEEEGWAWGQLTRDGYVGYVSMSALAERPAPTHRVEALRAHVYPAPSIKTPPRFALTYDALVCVVGREGAWAKTSEGFVYAPVLVELGPRADDSVAVAERFLGAPYLWGGRSSQGLDCSGLVQTALRAAGIEAPRDSDMLTRIGEALPVDETMSHLRRGDLVFWKGHVGLMRDATTMLHANATHLMTVAENLREARARILIAGDGPVTAARRVVQGSSKLKRPAEG